MTAVTLTPITRESTSPAPTLYAGRAVAASTVAAGVCDQCGQVAASDQATTRTATCQCGSLVKLTAVRGTYSSVHNCDDRCLYARRGDCVCSCGGWNHQRGYLVAELIPAHVVERNRRDHAAKVARRQAKADAAHAQVQTDLAAFAERHPLVVAWLNARTADNDFAASLARQLAEQGDLSPRQVETVERIAAEDTRRAAERAAEPAPSPAPVGKATVTGKILTTRSEPSAFSYSGTDYRMLVLSDDGFRCWGTIPASIHGDADGMIRAGWLDRLKGKRVTFAATLSPKQGDPTFAYFKRPTKAEVLDQDATAE